MSLLMWGIVYQGYNAIFPSFYPELFPTRSRVSAMAIAQNIGTLITALLPALFATVAPPGSTNIPLTVGSITLGVTIIAAIAAWSARETYRIRLNDLGKKDAVPMSEQEYERMRADWISVDKVARRTTHKLTVSRSDSPGPSGPVFFCAQRSRVTCAAPR